MANSLLPQGGRLCQLIHHAAATGQQIREIPISSLPERCELAILRGGRVVILGYGLSYEERSGTVSDTVRCEQILLADDHAVFREGLGLLMSGRGLAKTVLQAANGEEALKTVLKTPDLDLVILDLFMPGMEDLAILRQIHKNNPSLPIVVLTASEKRHDLRAVMEAGATGFIPKSFGATEVLMALEQILDGEDFFPADALAEDGVSEALRDVTLSPRQREVLVLISQGFSNKEIARKLDTALPTVKNHVANIFEKLGTNNRVAAVNIGRRTGLIPES